MKATAEHRLVTITGPGGIGKTRLAIEGARQVAANRHDGVAFIDLAVVRDAAIVPAAIAEGLGLTTEAGEPPLDLVIRTLGPNALLLVLDNFEQVLAAAPTVGLLLARCPGLRVIVTSRAPLRLRGEHELDLAPLPLPPSEEADLSRLEANDAVRFFLGEVRRHSHIQLSAENAPAIVDICRQLDGLPLALEVVAAMARTVPLPAVREQLRNRLDLEAEHVDMPARQRTLRAAIDWSLEILPSQARELFARLSVFVGGFTAAAVAVAAPGSDASSGLDELVRHSLVMRMPDPDPDGDGLRFGMLDTIREIGLEHLDRMGATDEAHEREIQWLGGLLEQAGEGLTRRQDTAAWRERLDAERGNVREAIGWAASAGRDELALTLAAADDVWLVRGSANEGLSWLRVLLDRPATYPEPLRLRALLAAARLGWKAGDLDVARMALVDAAAILERLGDRRQQGAVAANLGLIAESQGQHDLAKREYERALAIMRELGYDFGIVDILTNLGVVAERTGNLDEAALRHSEALAIARSSGDSDELGLALSNVASIALRRGDLDQARRIIGESLAVLIRVRDVEGQIDCVETAAEILVATGRHDEGVRFLAGAHRWREESGFVRSSIDAREADALKTKLRGLIGDAMFDGLWTGGLVLTGNDLIATVQAWADAADDAADA